MPFIQKEKFNFKINSQINPKTENYLFLPIIFYSLLIFYLSNLSSVPYVIKQFEIKDKILHFFGFFAYYHLLFLPIWFKLSKNKEFTFIKISIVSILFSTFFAITDEIHQGFIIGRDSDVFDLIADLLGILVAFGLTNIIFKKFNIK